MISYSHNVRSRQKLLENKQQHTWAARESCGPGWDEGFRSGRAPEVSGADSPEEWSQSARCSSGPRTDDIGADANTHKCAHTVKARRLIHNAVHIDTRRMRCYYCLTFISISCMTSGKTSMELEWAMSVCIRRQFMMVVGTVFSMFPLRSTSSSSSSLAILLKMKEWGESIRRVLHVKGLFIINWRSIRTTSIS